MNTISMNISEIKYISLEEDFFKRFLLRSLLKNFNHTFSWIKGVRYTEENIEFKKYLSKGFHDYLYKQVPSRIIGVAGCWIAHSHALESITNKEGITVILEDDFVCKNSFFQTALDLINKFDQEFDIFLFDARGAGPISDQEVAPHIFVTDGISYPYYIGSHCLFVNNKSVDKILNSKLKFPIQDYDGFLFRNDNGLKVFNGYTNASTSLFYGSGIDVVKKSFLRNILAFIKWFKYSRQ